MVGIFLIGGIAVIASMIRLHALWAYFNSKDPGYDAIGVSLHAVLSHQSATLNNSRSYSGVKSSLTWLSSALLQRLSGRFSEQYSLALVSAHGLAEFNTALGATMGWGHRVLATRSPCRRGRGRKPRSKRSCMECRTAIARN